MQRARLLCKVALGFFEIVGLDNLDNDDLVVENVDVVQGADVDWNILLKKIFWRQIQNFAFLNFRLFAAVRVSLKS